MTDEVIYTGSTQDESSEQEQSSTSNLASTRLWYQVPVEEWLENEARDLSDVVRTTRGGRYLPIGQALRLFRIHYPQWWYEYTLEPSESPGTGLFIRLRFVHLGCGVCSPTYMYPVRKLGTGNMAGIANPDARQISDAEGAAFRKALALWCGLGFSMYVDDPDLSPDESKDIDNITSSFDSKPSKRKKKEESSDFEQEQWLLGDFESEVPLKSTEEKEEDVGRVKFRVGGDSDWWSINEDTTKPDTDISNLWE